MSLRTQVLNDLDAIFAGPAGETVTYTRYDAAGDQVFARSVGAIVRVQNRMRRDDDDGETDITVATFTIKAADTDDEGVSDPSVDTDEITRSDGTDWAVTKVLSVNHGAALIEAEKIDMTRKANRDVEIDR